MRWLILAAVLLTGAASAQSFEPEVTLEAAQTSLEVSSEQPETFTLKVGFQSDNPFDGQQERQFRLVYEPPGSGWTISVPPEPIRMTSGETRDVQVTVVASPEASSSKSVAFKAILVPRGLEATPIGAAVDAESESEPVTMKFTRNDPLTRTVLEGLGNWIWAVLGAVATLIIALVVVVSRQNRVAVALESDVKEATVAPGRSVAISVTVINLTNMEDTVLFHVAPVRAGWTAHLPVPELELDGKKREELHLIVTAPKIAKDGEQITVGVSAHSVRSPRKIAELIVHVMVRDTPDAKATQGKK